ncbi:hypothetical protein SCG7086_AS_00080 [Chlamydiales bacterium SCGC AG-110-P3]|nr:hypothetical protein SCG7086_AS_00080 [Chlamydiales bacterium SCGC AG-110-P3]
MLNLPGVTPAALSEYRVVMSQGTISRHKGRYKNTLPLRVQPVVIGLTIAP